MKNIFQVQVVLPFRAKGKFYDPIKGHTGVDLAYINEELDSPVTGSVERTAVQVQMGKVLYIKDAWGNVHVFAHLGQFLVKKGDHVTRGQLIAMTDTTGTAVTGPHLHYEIITPKPYRESIDKNMTRVLWNFKGYNTDPIPYLLALYNTYHINPITGEQVG